MVAELHRTIIIVMENASAYTEVRKPAVLSTCMPAGEILISADIHTVRYVALLTTLEGFVHCLHSEAVLRAHRLVVSTPSILDMYAGPAGESLTPATSDEIMKG
jgi:hypothetical protein